MERYIDLSISFHHTCQNNRLLRFGRNDKISNDADLLSLRGAKATKQSHFLKQIKSMVPYVILDNYDLE